MEIFPLMSSGTSPVLKREDEGRKARCLQAGSPSPCRSTEEDLLQRITMLIYRVAVWLSRECEEHWHPRDKAPSTDGFL